MQILAANTIVCKTLEVDGTDDVDAQPTENNALGVILSPTAVSECLFKGITKASVKLVRKVKVGSLTGVDTRV